jgi:ADP-ribosyl-[dinitrogen reductase] hydrolase
MSINKDKVRGFFLGTAVGDALGLPVEGWSYDKIRTVHKNRLETYVSASGHKWFNNEPLGSWTDDTQLTLAVAKGLIEAQGLDMDKQAQMHIAAYKNHTSGWGRSTRESIEKLLSGIHWRYSGVYTEIRADMFPRGRCQAPEGEKPRGFGNGVSMKAGPIGVFLATKPFNWRFITEKMAEFAGMTHRTSMAVSSGLAHAFAVFRCIVSTPETFDTKVWINTVINASALGKNYFSDTLKDDITSRLRLLDEVHDLAEEWTPKDFIRDFGAGSYYVYDSLPFTYAFFVKDPFNIETLYECASAGGDTDSNASMLGGLMGALHGASFFPKHLIEGLQKKDEIIKIADTFSQVFQVGGD